MAAKIADQPIEIYHIEGRRSFRVAWLCEELGVPYRLIFKPGDVAGSMQIIRAECPDMPMSPVVRFGGKAVFESGAILDILLARAGETSLKPPVGSVDFLYHTQWMHYAEASAQARMLKWRLAAMALDKDVDELPRGYKQGAPLAAPPVNMAEALLQFVVGPRAIFEAIDAFLQRFAYFGGSQFTAADIMMHYQVRHAMLMSLIDLEDFPVTRAWRAKVEARPAFMRADQACHPTGVDEHGLPVGSPPPFPLRRSPSRN